MMNLIHIQFCCSRESMAVGKFALWKMRRCGLRRDSFTHRLFEPNAIGL